MAERRLPVPEAALATLEHQHFFADGWIYERKLDGERCLASSVDGRVVLHSRSGRTISRSFPEIVDALSEQSAPDFVVDGEVVAFDGNCMSFSMLQPRMQVADPVRARRSGVRVWYYVFDLVSLDGRSTRGLELRARKQLLRRLFGYTDPLRFTTHRNGAGAEYFDTACRRGWEGLMAKRADSRYAAGRTKDWRKFKCENEQEFVIAGYTEPSGSRAGFGALLLGHYRGQDLVFAGKVGTGFDNSMLERLHRLMIDREQREPAFTLGALPSKDVHWLRPELVGEVAFTEWTHAGQLRHPRFLGLRRDKNAHDVVRE